MTTSEGLPVVNELARRVQVELDFQPDQRGEWLIGEADHRVSGITGPEFLPTRIRVPASGNRLEFGVHSEDLSKYLELGRISGDQSLDIEHVRSFWPADSRFAVREEDDGWLYVGSAIEPTIEGFEQEYASIRWGIAVTMTAALKGKTYQEMKADTSFGGYLEEAERINTGSSGLVLFPRETIEEDELEDDSCELDSGCPEFWDREAENLRGYHIETWDTFVSETATELRLGDTVFVGTGLGHLGRIQYLDERGARIDIHDHAYTFDDTDGQKIEGKRWHAELPIGDLDIKTIDNMTMLTNLSLKLETTKDAYFSTVGEAETIELAVQVSVEDHMLSIKSEDGELGITFYEPACIHCEKPIWKFEENLTNRRASSGSASIGSGGDIIMEGGSRVSSGMSSRSIGEQEYGKRPTMCCDSCYGVIQEDFATEFPLARRENALAAVRAKLDELGYADVELDPTRVFTSYFGQGGDIEMFAYIDYERGGRKITRRAGIPTLTYDGIVTPNMPSREYVEFR